MTTVADLNPESAYNLIRKPTRGNGACAHLPQLAVGIAVPSRHPREGDC